MSATVSLHPALTHAQAEQVCKRIGVQVVQDLRGNVRLVELVPRPEPDILCPPLPEPPRAA